MALISSTLAEAVRKGPVKPQFFLRIDSTPEPLRCWTGFGPREIPVDAVEDDAAAKYIGVGALQGLPVMEALVNGLAGRTDFYLNGVTPEVVALAIEGADGVRGAEASFGVQLFDRDDQPVDSIYWARRGVADGVRTLRRSGVHIIAVSIGWGLINRRRAELSFFIDQEQQERSAGDRFCERTPLYERATRKWPKWDS